MDKMYTSTSLKRQLFLCRSSVHIGSTEMLEMGNAMDEGDTMTSMILLYTPSRCNRKDQSAKIFTISSKSFVTYYHFYR